MLYIHTRCTYFTTYIQQMLVFLPSFLTAAVYNPLSTVNKSLTLQTDDPMYAHIHTPTHYIYSCIQCDLLCSSRRFHIGTLNDSKKKKNNEIEIFLNAYYIMQIQI